MSGGPGREWPARLTHADARRSKYGGRNVNIRDMAYSMYDNRYNGNLFFNKIQSSDPMNSLSLIHI